HWKNIYDNLVSSLDHFLSESEHLDSVLQQDGAREWSGLEESLAYVDAAYASLDAWSLQIDRTRRILGRVRNRSRLLVPFNKLPAEVVVHILSLADTDCIFKYRNWLHKPLEYQPSPLANVLVASKWLRDVAASAPSLCTHVDLSVNEPYEAAYLHHARSCLEFSGQQPLDVHVLDDTRESQRRSMGVIRTLAPHAHRISSLNIEAEEPVMNEILTNLFGNASTCQMPDGHLNEALQPLRVIMIDGAAPPLHNLSFRSLAVLKLSVFHPEGTSSTLGQFRSFLATCPELRALTLILSQFDTDLEPPNEPVFLPKLELLDIRQVGRYELLWLLSCITPGSDALTLSMGSYSLMSEDDPTQLQRFIANSNVTRLHLEDVKWPSEFSRIEFPAIQELALSDYDFSVLAGGAPLDARRFPSLHTLHLLRCNPGSDIYHPLVDLSAIRLICADEPSYKLLSGVVPSVQCRSYPRISQVKDDLEWPVDPS
ncbi:hypothetical protein FRC10_008482, partial [Ceratobasidium sp. 414]